MHVITKQFKTMKKTTILLCTFFALETILCFLVKHAIDKYDRLEASKTPFILVYVDITNYNLRDTYAIPNRFTDTDIGQVLKLCNELNIPEDIAFNLIYKESNFDSCVVSKEGCYGYMQLHPSWFNAKDNKDNIKQGLTFLKEQFIKFGTWEKAVIYYNSGNKIKSDPEFVRYILNHK